MVSLRMGKVLAVTSERPGAVEVDVEVGGERAAAIAYPDLTGPVGPGDRVLLNTTAVELGLGTGGVHFVVAVEGAGDEAEADDREAPPRGRVMKARYTPLQTAVASVEQTHAGLIEASTGLDGMPVVAAPLHSMIGPIAAGAVAAGASRVAYAMTDGAALPGSFSRLVARLRDQGLLAGFVTCGQAFGGELEAVGVWTGLLAAKEILHADVVVVADGPGNLGTETKWGVSALASGNVLNAIATLGGRPVAAIRMSFADARDRHRGVSHHSLTILSDVCRVPVTVAVPQPEGEAGDGVFGALQDLGHEIVTEDGHPALELLASRGISIESMGRTAADDPAFFLAAGAAGAVAGRMASAQPPR
ncbi:MAG: DUF3866 family protein [Actinomycetota bacterium]